MSLTLNLDANMRLLLEPGYRHDFSAAGLTSYAHALDPFSARYLWAPPGVTTIQLKPMQLQPDFLNHQAQLDQNCVVRLGELLFNSTDQFDKRIYEINIGSTADPWINHLPATNLPDILKHVVGLPPGFPTNLQDVADQSETGSTTVFGDSSGVPTPVPNALIPLVTSFGRAPQNQGWLFRWWVPPPQLGRHQTIYAFVFAQYCALSTGQVLQVYEDTSPSHDRTAWTRRWREPLWAPGAEVNHLKPDWPLGRQLGTEGTGEFRSLLIIPVGRQKVLFTSDNGKSIVGTVRAHPQRTMDGTEWDILKSGAVEVWALTPVIGQFQIQRVKYPNVAGTSGAGLSTLSLPDLIMEYTPIIFPSVNIKYDADAGSQLIADPLSVPPSYTFPEGPLADDCPPATNLSTGLGRTFGEQLRFIASPDQRVSPQLYSLELISQPVFMDNPSPYTSVGDTSGPSGPYLQHVELSLGINPGDGRMTCHVIDVPDPDPPHTAFLEDFRFRSEVPVQLVDQTGITFSGYTDRLEVQPWRGDPASPVEMRLRCNDRWLLLEKTILREQANWQHVGHISVVDSIFRQCGIDTGDLHPDGTFFEDGTPVMSGGSRAEYPAGWDGALSSSYNTPLGTPIQNSDNLEGNQLLGWKPQPHDTGASYIKRITDLFSNWLVGFRTDGTPYYLPYTYFTQSTVIFHAHASHFVESGLNVTAGVGLVVNVSPGTASIGGEVVAPANVVPVPPNATSTLYLMQDGTVDTNTTGMPPEGSVTLGTATTNGSSVTSTDDTATSPRQTKLSRIYRRPLEYRTIEPSGNFVQVIGHFQLDQTANRSGLFVDWASLKNPKVVNYLGRPKWFIYEAGGAHSCAQLNRMAYIVFQAARRRRLRVSFDGTYVPTLKIGQIFTLEGIGDFRLLELRAMHVRSTWQTANYVGERVEKGYGLPS
jgi:hypothetical protein